VVENRDQAADWYERLLGRPPDFLPNDAEAVWQLAGTASVYLMADAERAGRGVVALVVDDLAASLAEIAGRGIVSGTIEEIPGAGRKSVIVDPDGNAESCRSWRSASPTVGSCVRPHRHHGVSTPIGVRRRPLLILGEAQIHRMVDGTQPIVERFQGRLLNERLAFALAHKRSVILFGYASDAIALHVRQGANAHCDISSNW
jgi:hypothetical protein